MAGHAGAGDGRVAPARTQLNRPALAPHALALHRDRLFLVALAAGPLACLALTGLPGVALRPAWPAPAVVLYALLLYPLVEEWVFRGQLQPWLGVALPGGFGPLSWANLATSVVFAALHLLFHPPLWAAGVLLPSLVFGFFRDRHGRLTAPVLLHGVYNASYHVLLAG